MMIYLLFVLLAGVYLASTGEIKTYRLPTDVTPSHYTIRILPDFDNNAFDGEASIYVRSRVVLNKIILHSSQLNITKVFINQIEGIAVYQDDEKIHLQYHNKSIQPGEHLLHIKYRGLVLKQGTGLLASLSNSDEKGYIFVTEFEPTGARRVFPCFDEPSFKAKFKLRLITPNDTYRAIANMPEINKFSTSYGIVHDFATSVTMSTYLLSFAMTTYEYYEDIYEENNRKIPIRIYSFNASKTNNQFAMNCTKNALKFFSDYTSITYPLPKLDMAEYDRVHSAATENWGLITFKRGLLSITLDIYDDMQIKIVIYHELSHFWFGNLVTNDWWNDLWLQEGFATYMAYKIYSGETYTRQPEKHIFFDGFIEAYLTNQLSPIVDYLSSHDHIEGKFTQLVYGKGAAVIQMVEAVIGQEAFQKAVQTFLSKFAYRTATTNDFISVLEEVASDYDLRSVIESYVYQTRFPVINIDGSNGQFILTQSVAKTKAIYSPGPGPKWTVPINYITYRNISKLLWFDKDMESLTLEEPEATWIMLNSQGTGLYRVNYSGRNWQQLYLQYGTLTHAESATLINDAFYSYSTDVINCDVPLNIMKEVRLPSDWNILIQFHRVFKKRLGCNKYEEELNIYLDFLYRRFNETGYHTKPAKKIEECDVGEELPLVDEQKENLKKCAEWIRENLPKSNDVTGRHR